jgi:hypothetical protein
VRLDTIVGRLEPDELGVASFEGSMSYAFSVAGEDRCSQQALSEAQLPALPCEMRYTLVAERIRAPEPTAH